MISRIQIPVLPVQGRIKPRTGPKPIKRTARIERSENIMMRCKTVTKLVI